MYIYNRVFRSAFQKSWSRTVALTDQKEDTRSFLAVVTYYPGQAFKVLSNRRTNVHRILPVSLQPIVPLVIFQKIKYEASVRTFNIPEVICYNLI